MKLEIEITNYDYTVLKRISEYSEIDVNKLVKGIIVNVINEFDTSMSEFIERSLPLSYFDDYVGRYIE